MRSSWPTSNQAARRGSERVGVPSEVETGHSSPPRTLDVPANFDTAAGTVDTHETGHWTRSEHRTVEVLPGSLLLESGALHQKPPEPCEPPPIPTQIIPFLVLGESQSGKTSIVRRLLYREEHPRHGTATQQHHPASVEYHKKDICFWHRDQVCCVRVQFWDLSGGLRNWRSEWNTLLHKASSGIVLVTSLSNGYTAMLETIAGWKKWLDITVGVPLSVTLLVNKCDLLPASSDPSLWIRLGSDLSGSCRELGIEKWHLTSCVDNTASVEDIFMGMIKTFVDNPVKDAPLGATSQKKVIENPKDDRVQPPNGAHVVEARAVPIMSVPVASGKSETR